MAEEPVPLPAEAEKMEETEAPSTSAEQVEGVEDVDTEAKKLMGAGRRHMVMKDVRSAVNAFQEASSLLGKKYGETADQCADAFFSYGMALLELARMENGVLGNALEGIPEDEEEDGEKEDDPNIPSAANLDEKEREQLREQVYDAMAEPEKPEKSDAEEAKTDGKAENGDVDMEQVDKPSEEKTKKDSRIYQEDVTFYKGKPMYLEDYERKVILDEGEKFLRDYILNKVYVESESNDDEECPPALEEAPHVSDSEDEEELKQLKKLKRKELQDKLEKLRELTGDQNIGVTEEDLLEDFEPEKHDQIMQKCFGDDYYGVGEDQKPQFNDAEEECDEGEEDAQLHCYDQNVVMDAEFNPQEGPAPSHKERKRLRLKKVKNARRRRKSVFAEAVSRDKPVFNPDDKTFQEYVEEYYKLDYEDIVDDLPCRFKYRQVLPCDFGLSTEEILTADDKELNRWRSLRKTCMYRSGKDDIYDQNTFSQKAQNLWKRQQILKSITESAENSESTMLSKTKVGKKRRDKLKSQSEEKKVACLDNSAAKHKIAIKPKKKRGPVMNIFRIKDGTGFTKDLHMRLKEKMENKVACEHEVLIPYAGKSTEEHKKEMEELKGLLPDIKGEN